MNRENNDSLLGLQLDEYRLESLLGHGGMARVYRALDVQLMRYAAIKVIDTPFRQDAEYVRRFEREAQAIARLEHTNVVRLYRYGQVMPVSAPGETGHESGPILYMAMQYIQGKDLGYVLDSYRLDGEYIDAEEGLRVIRQVCQALDYVHQQGIIHRDIKPSNIMLANDDGHAILTDFGLALLTQMGTRGEIFGSPHYIAPEQAISSAKAVPQSDLYAVGVILFEMFTGVLPFNAPDALNIALLHMSEPPPMPRSIRPEISPAIEAVILKALGKKPEERYSTGQALADALEQALHGQPAPARAPRRTVLDRVTIGIAASPLPPMPAAVTPPQNIAMAAMASEPTDPSVKDEPSTADDGIGPADVSPGADLIHPPAPTGPLRTANPGHHQPPPTIRLHDALESNVVDTPVEDPSSTFNAQASVTAQRPAEQALPARLSPVDRLPQQSAPARVGAIPRTGNRNCLWIVLGTLALGLVGLVFVVSLANSIYTRLSSFGAALGGESPQQEASRAAALATEPSLPIENQPPTRTPPPLPTTAANGPQVFQLVIARCPDEGCLVIMNTGKYPLRLDDLRLYGKGGEANGSEWGLDLLLPGKCVEIVKDEDWFNRLPNGLSCELVGNHLSRSEGKERFWKDVVTIDYGGQKAGTCAKRTASCSLEIPR